VDLRQCRPPGSLNAQVLEGMLRDLVGADLSLLPPLLVVVQQPELLALDPDAASQRQRAQLRDRILAGLSGIYHAGVLDRLRSFLDGYLNLEVIAWRQEPPAAGRAQRSEPSPRRTAAATTTVASNGPAWMIPAAGSAEGSAAAGSPAGSSAAEFAEGSSAAVAGPAASPGFDRADPAPQRRVAAAGAGNDQADQAVVAGPVTGRRAVPLLLGMVLVAAAAIAVGARMPPVCTRLGWCASAASAAASEPSLAAADRAATALNGAADLASFERNLAELDHQLGRLPAAGLTPQQQQRRDSLQVRARQGRQRLERERQQARLVAQAQERGRALAGLPAERQAAERTALEAELTAIAAGSFAHAAAQQQLQALRGPTPAAATPPSPTPTPEPAQPGPGSAEPPRSRSRPPQAPGAAGQAVPPSPRRAEPPPAPEPAPEPERSPVEQGRDKPAASREESGGGRKPARSIDQNEGTNKPLN